MAVLEVRRLTKCYAGGFLAVDGVDLAVDAGEVHALLGPNGAGKTTTVGCVTGALRPTSGEVTIAGIDIGSRPSDAKRLIGYVPDEPFLYDKLTALEQVELVARLFGLDRRPAAERAARLLEALELGSALHDQIGGFSHGMRQKVALATALVHDPTLLILDEPTVGLDPRAARQLKSTIRDLAGQGRSVLLCTHILEIAEALAHRVTVLDHGRVVASGTLDDLRHQVEATRPDVEGPDSLEAIFLALVPAAPERAVVEALSASSDPGPA